MNGTAPMGFRQAPDEIIAVTDRLIATQFPHLAGARILLLVREQAQASEPGQFAVAAAGVPTDEAQASQFDYVMWYAWDVWQILDEKDRDALTFHELTHCSRNDQTGKPELKPHDASVFNREVELYGMWWVDAQARFKSLNSSAGGESKT